MPVCFRVPFLREICSSPASGSAKWSKGLYLDTGIDLVYASEGLSEHDSSGLPWLLALGGGGG